MNVTKFSEKVLSIIFYVSDEEKIKREQHRDESRTYKIISVGRLDSNKIVDRAGRSEDHIDFDESDCTIRMSIPDSPEYPKFVTRRSPAVKRQTDDNNTTVEVNLSYASGGGTVRRTSLSYSRD